MKNQIFRNAGRDPGVVFVQAALISDSVSPVRGSLALSANLDRGGHRPTATPPTPHTHTYSYQWKPLCMVVICTPCVALLQNTHTHFTSSPYIDRSMSCPQAFWLPLATLIILREDEPDGICLRSEDLEQSTPNLYTSRFITAPGGRRCQVLLARRINMSSVFHHPLANQMENTLNVIIGTLEVWNVLFSDYVSGACNPSSRGENMKIPKTGVTSGDELHSVKRHVTFTCVWKCARAIHLLHRRISFPKILKHIH